MAGHETRQLIRTLTAQGFTVRLAASGHYRVSGPSGAVATMPATPSPRGRSMANVRANLRKHLGAVL
jgi:hypothetical protein